MDIRSCVRRVVGGLLLLCSAVAIPAIAQVATNLTEIRFSGDIDTRMPFTGGGEISASDQAVYVYDPVAGTADAYGFFTTLQHADLDGYSNTPGCPSSQLYTLDAYAEVNGMVMHPADVFGTFSGKRLDAKAAGIPDGVNVDAISVDPASCDLVFSIDVIASIDGVVYKPDDLIRWDGSAFGLWRTLNFDVNVDALHILEDGRFLYSVDVDSMLPGLVVQDDDVIESIPGGPGTFEVLAFGTRVIDSTWVAGDLDALSAVGSSLGPGGIFQDGFED